MCACADAPEQVCAWSDVKHSGVLVSCPDSPADTCRTIGPGLDPHAFQFNGHPMAFINIGSSGVCHPQLLNLTSLERGDLTLPGMAECEKNWQAFAYNGNLFFSQWLHPSHNVLKCSVDTYACELVFNTSTHFSTTHKIHGSTPYVELDSDHLVAAAHTFKRSSSYVGNRYWHMFYAIQREPPFAVVASTKWFRLPVAETHESAQWIDLEYAGGMMRQGEDVIVSYSVGDCVSQAVRVPIKSVKQSLGL